MSKEQTVHSREILDEKNVDKDPIRQFVRWFEEAQASGMPLPEAMTLATVDEEGKPSARMVLLKQVDELGFVFYTNYSSRKARELDDNPHAALVFYWPALDRQVRVEGSAARVSETESDNYFRTRPRESQIGAIASPQSTVIESREALEERFGELEKLYGDRPIDRPENWGGYRLKPALIEFWKGQHGRLHDRLLYELQSDGVWTIKRLAP